MNLKICIISDTHTAEADLKLPKGDILIHCGDFHIMSARDLDITNKWFLTQPYEYKILIAGNHDGYLENIGTLEAKRRLSNLIYLQDELVEIQGLKFYGSPWSPEFNNWYFMLPRRSQELADIWNKIPTNLDFLITHCPPYKILDKSARGKHCGCEILERIIWEKSPKYHVFGHIHECYGKKEINNIQFINASTLNGDYILTNNPIILEIYN